jgi:hypothetical protein
VRERQSIPVDGVFDIETEFWDKFVVGGLLDLRNDQSIYIDRTWHREDDFVDILLSFEGTLWAHNGGKFDVLWFLHHLSRRGIRAQIGLQGSRVARIAVGSLEIRDSYSLIPLRLADAAKIGGHEKAETGLPCVCEGDCGGYCSINRRMSFGDLAKLRGYLEVDCQSLAGALRALVGFCDTYDLDLATTVGQASWKTASRWLEIPDVDWGKHGGGSRYKMAREGYYGGRTQVFRPFASSGYRYDINSAYPAALSITDLPMGLPQIVENPDEVARSFLAGKEGIYTASVFVSPEVHVPPLPVHFPLRVGFPVGEIRGTWSGLELREAEMAGATIRSFGRSMVWAFAERVLQPFCEKVWQLRHTLGKAHPIAKWLKWFLNSCTGKLAQRPETERVVMNPDPMDVKLCHASDDCRNRRLCGKVCCEHRCSKKCGGWKSLSSEQGIWSHEVYRMAPSGYVHWAAYLTASTRLSLRSQLTADGQDGLTAVYCDTDSCYATRPRTWNTGKELGQWDVEGTFKDFRALAPKTYRYTDQNGNRHVRAKGIPGADAVWDQIAAGETITVDRGVNSLKLALRDKSGQLFKRRQLTRAVRADGVWFGDRKRRGEVTCPVPMAEVP